MSSNVEFTAFGENETPIKCHIMVLARGLYHVPNNSMGLRLSPLVSIAMGSSGCEARTDLEDDETDLIDAVRFFTKLANAKQKQNKKHPNQTFPTHSTLIFNLTHHAHTGQWETMATDSVLHGVGKGGGLIGEGRAQGQL